MPPARGDPRARSRRPFAACDPRTAPRAPFDSGRFRRGGTRVSRRTAWPGNCAVREVRSDERTMVTSTEASEASEARDDARILHAPRRP